MSDPVAEAANRVRTRGGHLRESNMEDSAREVTSPIRALYRKWSARYREWPVEVRNLLDELARLIYPCDDSEPRATTKAAAGDHSTLNAEQQAYRVPADIIARMREMPEDWLERRLSDLGYAANNHRKLAFEYDELAAAVSRELGRRNT